MESTSLNIHSSILFKFTRLVDYNLGTSAPHSSASFKEFQDEALIVAVVLMGIRTFNACIVERQV